MVKSNNKKRIILAALTLLIVMLTCFYFLSLSDNRKVSFLLENISRDKKEVDINIYVNDNLVYSDTLVYSETTPNYKQFEYILSDNKNFKLTIESNNEMISYQQIVPFDSSKFVFVNFDYKILKKGYINLNGMPIQKDSIVRKPAFSIYYTKNRTKLI